MRGILLAAAATAASAAIAADKVTSLPGWSGALLSDFYSGYLHIPGGKHLHYIFTASTGSPSTDPVTVWFNGGPGCSSMEGFLNENGLYHITPGTNNLYANPYSWGNITNMLFIEAPAGVGFSYADFPSGLVHNDTSTAQDNLNALIYFFANFPEYAQNELYISGESYAGIYVPSLASDVTDYNKGSPAVPLNLKGILVGNGCLGTEVGICGDDFVANSYNIEQWRGHGLISKSVYDAINTNCNWNLPTQKCQNLLNQAAAQVGHVSVYDIYGPCDNSQSSSRYRSSALTRFNNMTLEEAAASVRAGVVLSEPVQHFLKRPLTKTQKAMYAAAGLTGPDPCIDAGDLPTYLNSPAVKQALHVVDIPWVICTGNFSYQPTIQDERTYIYPNILSGGARVLIFNGEADACVPWQDNEWWTASMNYTVVKPWAAWMSEPDWVGGYVTQYQANQPGDFTFTTVRGAGHMVPEYQPAAAWSMFDRFINKKPW